MNRKSQIIDFFEGRLSEPQAKDLLDWLHSPEGEEYLSTEIDQIWAEKIKNWKYKELDTEALWQKIKASKGTHPKPILMKSTDKSKKAIPNWLKVACSFILLGVSIWVLLHSYPTPEDSPKKVKETVQMVSKYNPPGQKTKIHLQDGSIVLLNSDSKITYPTNFLTNRQIVLEGEAFFTVSKDTLHPFIVEAKGISTTALGTAFNVSTFNTHGKVKVTLVSGKVKLKKEGKTEHLILNPGEESLLSQEGQEFHKELIDISKRIMWTNGILIFEETPIMEVIDQLERWYGVKIEIIGNVPPSRCSGTFQNNEMLDNVLDVLSSSVGFKYKLEGKKVIINY